MLIVPNLNCCFLAVEIKPKFITKLLQWDVKRKIIFMSQFTPIPVIYFKLKKQRQYRNTATIIVKYITAVVTISEGG